MTTPALLICGVVLWCSVVVICVVCSPENEAECDVSLAAYTAPSYVQLHFNKGTKQHLEVKDEV